MFTYAAKTSRQGRYLFKTTELSGVSSKEINKKYRKVSATKKSMLNIFYNKTRYRKHSNKLSSLLAKHPKQD